MFDRIWDGKGVREEEGPLDWLRLAGAGLGVALVLWFAVSLILPHIYDPKMGAEAAGRALTDIKDNGGTYVCTPHDGNLGEPTFEFVDVDYECTADVRGTTDHVLIGTDRDSITDLHYMG